MKRLLKIASILLACGLACGYALGQTSSAKTTITVTAAPAPYLNVTITPSVTTVAQGKSVSFAVTATAPSGATQGAVVGAIELLVTPAGATTATMSSYTIVSGAVTASYVVNATAVTGTYTIEAAYCSSPQVTANYATSADCQ